VTSSHTVSRYRVKRADRASTGEVSVGDIVYVGNDCFGCYQDDTRATGIKHGAYSLSPNGEPWFTMPDEDVELLADEEVTNP
jgi:hypothetical protein